MNNEKKVSEPVARIYDVCDKLREKFPQHEDSIVHMEYYIMGYYGSQAWNRNDNEAIKEVKEIAQGFNYHELVDDLNKRLYQKPVPMITVYSNDIAFNVRIVQKGESYGKDNKLTHESNNPLVEFFDSRHKFSEYGQFVSRYYLSTLTEKGRTGGLQLEGCVPQWSISDKGMEQVRDWLRSFNSPYFGLSRNEENFLARHADILGKSKAGVEVSKDRRLSR